jgi:hypothetical protein
MPAVVCNRKRIAGRDLLLERQQVSDIYPRIANLGQWAIGIGRISTGARRHEKSSKPNSTNALNKTTSKRYTTAFPGQDKPLLIFFVDVQTLLILFS